MVLDHDKDVGRSAIVILGASGNLARKKLIPALSMLYAQGSITDESIVVGSGRSDLGHGDFRERIDCCEGFRERMYYHQGTEGLKDFLAQQGEFSNVVVFFSLPPHAYKKAVEDIYAEGFRDEVRLVIEKPFGYDYDSSRELNRFIASYYHEKQIFRIDHYLAKEAVQNMLVFRFANLLFEPVWNNHYVESIQINAFEDIGVEDRAAYFDSAGIIRDLIQNHLVQLLSLVTMEPPVTFSAEDIRVQKMGIMKSLQVRRCRRYQAEVYRSEQNIPDDSTTETFAELEAEIQNMRWSGVPVYIRAGKYMDRKGTEVGVRFRKLPPILFNSENTINQNQIIFKIQPSEGIIMDLASKTPGNDYSISDTNMKFCYREHFTQNISEAYKKLLLDALRGDKTLFLSAEESEITWRKFAECLNKNTLDGFYKTGEPPQSDLAPEWINFNKYADYC
ncbi:MAG: glucose-6-phosphate dehydrogenase [Fibrobacterota bacterium]